MGVLTYLCGEGNGNPLQCSWLETPRDGGAWWAAVYGVTESDTTEVTQQQQQQQLLKKIWVFKCCEYFDVAKCFKNQGQFKT